MATGGESSSSSSAGGPLEQGEDRFLMCLLCTVRCDPLQVLGCGHWFCFNCVVRLVDLQGCITCPSCHIVNVMLTQIRKLPRFRVGDPAVVSVNRANAICGSPAPLKVVITDVTPRPPLTDVEDERRRAETAQMQVRKRGAHTHFKGRAPNLFFQFPWGGGLNPDFWSLRRNGQNESISRLGGHVPHAEACTTLLSISDI